MVLSIEIKYRQNGWEYSISITQENKACKQKKLKTWGILGGDSVGKDAAQE